VELKLLLLILLFVYSFFKFTWSLRQYGFASVMMGGAPLPSESLSEQRLQAHAARIAEMTSLAANNFNIGLRTYYFCVAVLGWFINPWLFMLLSGIVRAVSPGVRVYRTANHDDEHRSRALKCHGLRFPVKALCIQGLKLILPAPSLEHRRVT
jgi:uncharacterized membrane protein